uniref:Uncharacterized protein n=1 Tax=Anguilla anguilla TaxID=7936 RepID=A0A0E9T2P8_ANGAN
MCPLRELQREAFNDLLHETDTP